MSIVPNRISRRQAFKLTGKAAGFGVAALATPYIMVRAGDAMAASHEAAPANATFNRFALGDFEVVTFLDGARPSEGPHPTFGQDQEASAVAELMRENFLPETQMVSYFTPTIVNTGSDVVLFDTGIGGGGRGNGLGNLYNIMQGAGVDPDEITVVVLTHMHPDHIGGLMEDGAPAFPNARYVTGQVEYDFWAADERMSGPTERVATLVNSNVKPMADKMTFIGDGGDVVSGITGMAAFGHTPGHMIYNIESGGKRVVITADTANHYVASLQRPDWHVRFDADKDAAAATRKRVFDMIATDRVPFIGYHMPFPGVGYIEKLDVGYRYVPETYQLDL